MRGGRGGSRGPEVGDAPKQSPDTRHRWLGHPAFLACVLVLAINDHVLKARFPGWWTGKLSDVAGVAVVGTVASVLAGPRRGLALTAAGFALIKTVPATAEFAGPVLGGVTRTDPTDLVALVVLVPLHRLLRVSDGRAGEGGRGKRAVGTAGWGRVRAAASATVPFVGSVAAVLATTATSCGGQPAVIQVMARNDTLYAAVQQSYYGATAWARSDDGGRTWMRSETPYGPTDTPPPTGRYDEGRPAGPTHVCAADDTCYRLRDQRVVERRPPGGDWVDEVGLTDDEFEDISTGCTDPQRGVLASIAVVDTDDGTDVVASLGAGGVLVRDGDRTWARTRVLGAPMVEATPTERRVASVFLRAGPVLLALWVVCRRRSPAWGDALAVGGLGWLATAMLMVVAGFATPSHLDPDIVVSRTVVVCSLLTAVAAAIWARRPWRPRLVPFAAPQTSRPPYPPPPFSAPPPPPAPPPPTSPPTLPPLPPSAPLEPRAPRPSADDGE